MRPWSASGKGGTGGHREDREEAAEGLGGRLDQRLEAAQGVLAVLQCPEGGAADDIVDRVRAEQERRHDAKIAAPAAQRPEEIGILVVTGSNHAAVGEDDVGAQRVADGEAAAACQVAAAAAEREAPDAGRGDEAAGCGQPEWVRGVVGIAPGGAAFDLDGARLGVDANAAKAAQIDDQPTIADAEAASADGDGDACGACNVDAGDDVGDVGDLGDGAGVTLDHAVVDRACGVVAVIARRDERAAQGPS